MTFDLRKDLKLYTSAKHTIVKRILDSGTKDGENIRYQANVRLVTKKSQYGEETAFEFDVPGVTTDAFRQFLNDIGASYLYSGSSYFDFSRANPDKTYDDFIAGFLGAVSVPKTSIDKFLERHLPANRMQALCFAENSRLAEMLGKRTGWSRRRSKERRARITFLAWALYGIEIPASAKRAEIDAAVKQLAPSDFGVPDCDVMDAMLLKLADVNVGSREAMVEAVKLIDGNVARFNGKPIQRKKPRAEWLKGVWSIVTGFGAVEAGSANLASDQATA